MKVSYALLHATSFHYPEVMVQIGTHAYKRKLELRGTKNT